jgi:hypothetical protein
MISFAPDRPWRINVLALCAFSSATPYTDPLALVTSIITCLCIGADLQCVRDLPLVRTESLSMIIVEVRDELYLQLHCMQARAD